MIVPGLSLDEEARLAALEACAVLDTLPEAAFEDLVELAQRVCGTAVAAISFIDSERQWFKAARGLGEMREMPRQHAFCHYTIQGSDTLVVPDAARDPRFRDNPFVQREDGVRFYAGVPVVTEEGARVGTLCVLDRAPRVLDAAQQAALEMLGRQVSTQLALRRTVAALETSRTAQAAAAQGLALVVAMRRSAVASHDVALGVAAMVDELARALACASAGTWRVASGGGLEPVGAYRAIADGMGPFVTATRETAFTRDVGLPGAALRAGSAVWLSDFVDEPSLPRMTAALAVGVRGAVSMPVRIDGQVAFVFELVARRDIARDEGAPALLALAAEEIACWVAATAQMTT
jgi:hypothetical protein